MNFQCALLSPGVDLAYVLYISLVQPFMFSEKNGLYWLNSMLHINANLHLLSQAIDRDMKFLNLQTFI